MADKPILFSDPMVRALLDERTTQTRRAIKLKRYPGFFQFGESDTRGYDWTFRRKDHVWEDYRNKDLLKLLPYQAGDRLWVRESWRVGAWHYGNADVAIDHRDGPRKTWLHVDDSDLFCRLVDQSREDAQKAGVPLSSFTYWEYTWRPGEGPCRWRPSIHMPRFASRITLTVTDVRIERLQDISSEDAEAEGMLWGETQHGDLVCSGVCQTYPIAEQHCHHWPEEAFAELWDSINGPGAWHSNPFVVVYSFDFCLKNIDRME